MTTKTIVGCDQCGWTSPATSPARAAYAFRQHSCTRRRVRDAATARRVARDDRIDRTPKPCLHPIARHVHGTHACYVLDRCRCFPCAVANANYEYDRIRRNAYGRSQMVDAAPARAHVRALMALGMGSKRIVVVSGVSHGSVSRLLYGDRGGPPSPRLRAATAARLLALTYDPAAGQLVEATGTARRLQALMWAGWSGSKLAVRLGMQRGNFQPVLYARRQVQLGTARAVRVLFEELWDTPPPQTNKSERISTSRSRNHARRAGWAPAMAWDEDTIDDPAASPAWTADERVGVDEVAVLRRVHGERTVALTRPERWLVVARLHAEGLNDRQIAERTGLIDRQILRDRQALGLPAIPPGRASA